MSHWKSIVILFIASLLPTAAKAAPTCSTSSEFGTFCRLFAASSPWNVVPISPTLGSATIPNSSYKPSVDSGSFSTGMFYAESSDSAMVVYPPAGSLKGIKETDSESYLPSISIPRWPKNVSPAPGSDGHADIVDSQTGVVHSFFRLAYDSSTGKWRASQYSWTKLNGRGFGTPAHYKQGARAAGVAAAGGIIRKHEIYDGKPMYYHSLAMSLTYNGLSKTYVYPATQTDTTASENTGAIPMGSRVMLPSTFDFSRIKTAEVLKIARTLQVFGAMVVDRNDGTPFKIYVEKDSGFSLHKLVADGWNEQAIAELEYIQAQLRPLQSATSWKAGAIPNSSVSKQMGTYKGAPYGIDVDYNKTPLNVLSMRRVADNSPLPILLKGSEYYLATFNSLKQAAVFTHPTTMEVSQAVDYMKSTFITTTWAPLVSGHRYALTANTTYGGKARIIFYDCDYKTAADTGDVGYGQRSEVVIPACIGKIRVIVRRPATSSAVTVLVAPEFKRVF